MSKKLTIEFKDSNELRNFQTLLEVNKTGQYRSFRERILKDIDDLISGDPLMFVNRVFCSDCKYVRYAKLDMEYKCSCPAFQNMYVEKERNEYCMPKCENINKNGDCPGHDKKWWLKFIEITKRAFT